MRLAEKLKYADINAKADAQKRAAILAALQAVLPSRSLISNDEALAAV